MNVNELLDTIEDALEESAGMPLSGGKRIVDVGQNPGLPGRGAGRTCRWNCARHSPSSATGASSLILPMRRPRPLSARRRTGPEFWSARQRSSRRHSSVRPKILSAAQSEARALRQSTTDYCDNMLKTTEETMAENAAQVRSLRANLRQSRQSRG